MKKICAIITVLAMALALFLTGCQSASSQSSASAAPTQSASAAPSAASDYPKKPIQIVVPFSAGGGTDLFARIVAGKMSEILKVAVEVVNMPGGSATIGTTDVANSSPDGYKLGFSISTPLAMTPNLGETSYTLDNLQPICNAYTTVHTICVAADSPIKTVDDLIAYIDSKDGKVSFAGSGTGNMQHLCLEEWVNQLGKDWDLTVVPYDGDNDEVVALLSGEAPFATVQAHGVKSYIESGQIRCLMAFGDTTPKWMVDGGYNVPNTVELGYTSAIQGPVGFYGPKGISEDVIKAVSAAVEEALKDEKVLESISNLGLEPDFRTTEDYTTALQNLVPASKDLMLQLGFIKK